MASFFDKLKKGMEIKNLPETEENSVEDLSQEQPTKEPSTVLLPVSPPASTKAKAVTKKKVATKKKTIKSKGERGESKKVKKSEKEIKPLKKEEEFEGKKIKVKEEPAVAPAAAPLSGDRTDEEEKIEKKWFEPEGQLTIDIYQTDKDIVVQSAIAGVPSEGLDISIENDMVIIKGRREKPLEEEERNYFFQECYWGRFSREIILPEEVDNSRAQASIKQGILTIRIPKIEKRKKRKIIIKE